MVQKSCIVKLHTAGLEGPNASFRAVQDLYIAHLHCSYLILDEWYDKKLEDDTQFSSDRKIASRASRSDIADCWIAIWTIRPTARLRARILTVLRTRTDNSGVGRGALSL